MHFSGRQAFFKPSSADIKVDVSYDKDALEREDSATEMYHVR